MDAPTTVPPPSPPNRAENLPPLLEVSSPYVRGAEPNVSGTATAAAQANGAPVAPAVSPGPQALIEAAVRAIERHRSISADIRQGADLFGQQLIGGGKYLESRTGPIPSMRLELRTELAGQLTSFVQVCDGQTLWTYRKLLQGESLGRIDAVRAHAALEQAAQSPAGQGNPAMLPGLGGLARMVRGLAASFEFTTAESGQVQEQPVWRLQGGWRAVQLVKLLPKQKDAILQGKPVDLSRIPEELPDSVVILLGQGDLFPYRIDYCRTFTKKGPSAETRSLMTVEFSKVTFNAPINPGEFIYTPNTPNTPDHTDEFLQSIAAGK